jgi:hypothetical protein
VAVDSEGRKRLVRLEQGIDRKTRRGKRRVIERTVGKHRGVAGGQQHGVALAQRHVELFGQPQYHVAARHRAPGFEEAQVRGGDLGIEGKVHLTQPPALAPVAQPFADQCRSGFHAGFLGQSAKRRHYLGRNRPAASHPSGSVQSMGMALR